MKGSGICELTEVVWWCSGKLFITLVDGRTLLLLVGRHLNP